MVCLDLTNIIILEMMQKGHHHGSKRTHRTSASSTSMSSEEQVGLVLDPIETVNDDSLEFGNMRYESGSQPVPLEREYKYRGKPDGSPGGGNSLPKSPLFGGSGRKDKGYCRS